MSPGFPMRRPRRLRRGETIRRLVRETQLVPDDLIAPLFVVAGEGVRRPIASMPGQFQWSVDGILAECRELASLGVPGVLLFGVPERKDPEGSGALDPEGPVPRAVRALKKSLPELSVWADVCLCEYTDHGHCGPLATGPDGRTDVDNDRTVGLLARAATIYAQAGADAVAPSDMMDGRVGAIRAALDAAGRTDTLVVSYSAKYASSFYGPFREAAGSTPSFGDRRGYQMDPANTDESLREVEQDLREGADIVMVKPALAFLDIVHRVKERFRAPVAAYNVSGEYSMVKAAARNGWLDEERTMIEILTSIRRAGADIVLSYFAKDAAKLLDRGRS